MKSVAPFSLGACGEECLEWVGGWVVFRDDVLLVEGCRICVLGEKGEEECLAMSSEVVFKLTQYKDRISCAALIQALLYQGVRNRAAYFKISLLII